MVAAPKGKTDKQKQSQSAKPVKIKQQAASGAVTGSDKRAQAKPAQSGTALAIQIGKIQIDKGSVNFSDYSLKPNFASGIEALQGSITHLSSKHGTTADVDLQGKIDRFSPITLKGKINPFLDPAYLDLHMKTEGVELTSVNPYSGTYLGYYIDKGLLSLDISYQLENNQLVGKNHVIIDQLTLGRQSDSNLATSLPVTLAIALLQDTHGVIDLGIGVSGDLNDPSFSIGGIVIKALINVVTKAVTSPFRLLADLVGSDDELDKVSFAAGLATLNSKEQDKLSKLASALQDRPKLTISIKGSVVPVEDSTVLAESQLKQKLLAGSGLASLPEGLSASQFPQQGALVDALQNLFVTELKGDINAEQAKVQKTLTEKAKEGTVPTQEEINTVMHIEMYNRLVKAQKVTDDDLANLAQARARAVKYYLVEGKQISPERVFLMNSKTKLATGGSLALMTLNAN